MSERPTPETAHALVALLDRKGTLFEDNAPEELVMLCRRLERERDAERAIADRLAEIVEEGIEDLDEDGGDWPQAFAVLAAWKEARSEWC